MPLVRDFLERVVPWPVNKDEPGYINIHYTLNNIPGVMPGIPFRDVDAALNYVQSNALNTHLKDIYFCLSLQSHTTVNKAGKVRAVRLAANALGSKALWLDVDVKPEKGYATLKEALDAIFAFIKANNFPPPSAIVYSGGGIHVYWISESVLSVAEWEPYAAGLRDLAVRYGLRCDAGLTTDIARVLRVPGTFNRKEKTPRPVVLKYLGASYNFATTLGWLAQQGAPLVTAKVTKSVAGRPQFDMSGFKGYVPPAWAQALDPKADTLSAGIERKSDLPLKMEGLVQCPHFDEAVKTGGVDATGKGYSQGLWMLDVLSSVFTDGERTLAHALSRGHKGYSAAETDAMYDRKVADRAGGLGWPGCHAFENEGCKLCASCVYKGKIASPLNLTTRVDPPPADALPPPMVADRMVEPSADEYDLNLPEDYQLNDDGFICRRAEIENEKGEREAVLLKLFQVRVGRAWLSSGVHPAMHLKIELGKEGLQDLVVPQVAFTGDQRLREAMDSTYCVSYTPHERHLRHFMKSWYSKMIEAEVRVQAAPYGWLMPKDGGDEPIGFCYGGKVFHPDGKTSPAGIADNEIKEGFSPAGKDDSWHKLAKIITDQHNPALEVLALASFAAPLMFIGEKAGILWAWSNESGAFKSTAIALGQAVWGGPPRAKLRAGASHLAIEHRFGTLRNLPIYVDEVRRDPEVESIANMAGTLTEGGTAAKMLRSGTEQRATMQWQTLMCVGSNQDCRPFILKQNAATDAGLMRVFVIDVKPGKSTEEQSYVTSLVNSLDNNHGQMGLAYAKHIATHRGAIGDEGRENYKAIERALTTNSAERFWVTLCAALLTAAATVNDILSEPIFHEGEVFTYLMEQFQKQRAYTLANCAVGSSGPSAFNAVNKYFNSTLDHQLWTANMQNGRGRTAVTLLHMPMGPREQDIRVHWVRDKRLVHISKKRLEEWLMAQTPVIAPMNVLTALREHYDAKIVDRVQLTAGIANRGQAREQVVEIPIPEGSDWEPNLLSHSTAEDLANPVADPGAGGVAPPRESGIPEAAMEQAGKDLALVRSTT